jgi:hypothetical protein
MASYEVAKYTTAHHSNELLISFSQIVSIAPQLELDETSTPTGNAIIRIGVESDSESGIENIGIPESLPAISEAGTVLFGQSVPVVVSIEGKIRLAGNTARKRPCPGGFSVGNFLNDSYGTLGGVMTTGNGIFNQILSNNHVLTYESRQKADLILQPGSNLGGKEPNDTIGTLSRVVPISLNSNNEVDCALATCAYSDLDRNVFEIGKPEHVAIGNVGDTVRKSGATSGLTTGVIVSTYATIRVKEDGGTAIFVGQLQLSPMIDFGDSGSLIWLQNSLTVIGLAFSRDDTYSYANHISRVLDFLNNFAISFDEDGNIIEAPALAVSLLENSDKSY